VLLFHKDTTTHFTFFISHTSVWNINLGRSFGTLLKIFILFLFYHCFAYGATVFLDRIILYIDKDYTHILIEYMSTLHNFLSYFKLYVICMLENK